MQMDKYESLSHSHLLCLSNLWCKPLFFGAVPVGHLRQCLYA